VTLAWDDLKTPERRAAYDEARRTKSTRKLSASKGGGARTSSRKQASMKRLSNGAHRSTRRGKPGRSLDIYRVEQTGLLHRALLFLFGGARR
jgi:hypothetical protein